MIRQTRRPAFLAGLLSAALVATTALGAAAQDAGTAKVRVLHASPDAPAVDVYADGAAVLTNVAFGVISSYLEVPAGDHQIQVFATGADPMADTPVIDATLTFAADTMTTVAATNSVESIEAQVIADMPMPSWDGAQVRVVHLSADTPAVDIAPDGGEEIIQGLAYPMATDYLTVPAGQLDVELRPAGAVDGWVALNPGGVLLDNGHSYTEFAIGSLADGSLRILTAIDAVAAPQMAKVRVLHASPDAPAVDIYADGAEVLSDVPFGVISDYLEVPAGEHQIQVVAAGADPADGAVIDAMLDFAPNTMTTVAATNNVAMIEAQVISDMPMPRKGKAQVRVVHLSADAPAVDIAPDGKKNAPIVAELAYPNATDYLTVKPGDYDLEIRPAGTTDVAFDIDDVTLEGGHSYTVFAIGSIAGGTFTVLPVVDATRG